MRLLSAAIVLSLLAVTASAQTPLHNLSPAARTVRPVLQPPHLGPAPRLYTMQQRAFAVQRLLNLTTTPALGQPFSLNPSAPYIAGVGELDYGGADVWSGDVKSGTAGGMASFAASGPGWIGVLFNARAGQRYALDCRLMTYAAHLDYDVAPRMVNGTVPVGQDGHILVAVDKASTDQSVEVHLYPDTPVFWVFYGCDVSPF